MEIEEIKHLSPEQRIIKLKEIEEKNRLEIEEAQKMLESTEAEIEEDTKKKREMPIPQLRAISIDNLFAGDAKEMWKTKHFVSSRREEAEERKPGLEEQTEEEHREMPEQRRRSAETARDYGQMMESYQAINLITNRLSNLYHVAQTGPVTEEEKDRALDYRNRLYEEAEKMAQYQSDNDAAIAKMNDAKNIIQAILGEFYQDQDKLYR